MTPRIRHFEDIADRMMNPDATGALCVDESELDADFFNLRTGVAGDLLQKLVNYRLRMALVIRDPLKYGERFSELAREHQTHPLVRFFKKREDAERWLQSGDQASSLP